MTPVSPPTGGSGVGGGGGGGGGGNLTCFLDSPHMVSYYLPIHFMVLKAILKKIVQGFT